MDKIDITIKLGSAEYWISYFNGDVKIFHSNESAKKNPCNRNEVLTAMVNSFLASFKKEVRVEDK